MYDAYKKSVMAYYQSLKVNHQLPAELENPSPGKLKRVCVKILSDTPEKRDLDTLQSFFNAKNEYEHLEKSIDAYDPDKLRPLVKLMKGEIADSINDDNYRLLTVLIGFEPRPYTSVVTPNPPPAQEPANPDDNVKTDLPNSEKDGVNEPKVAQVQPPKWKKAVLYSNALLVFAISVYIFYFPSKSHMIWRIDRYHPTTKTELTGDTMLVALDKYRLEKFRKIMEIDTVTAYSIGKLYYLKTDNIVELFTAGGKHPIYTERQLKILSREIYDKYLNKDSQVD